MYTNMMRYGTEAAQRGFDDRYLGYHPMMGSFGIAGGEWLIGILCLVTWILIIAMLVALTRWLWLKGDKERIKK